MITEVEKGSPADRAALRQGDVLVSLDGQAVSDIHDLFAVLASGVAGREVVARIIRGGDGEDRTIVPAERD